MSIINISGKGLQGSNPYISLCVFIGKITTVLKIILLRHHL